MIIVTGAAGFIGSVLAAALKRAGHQKVVVVDWLEAGEKWRNLQKDVFFDYIFPESLTTFLETYGAEVQGVFHMGAISATTARDGDEILRANLHPTMMLWRWCAEHGRPFIYASSAATYGDGSSGFDDDISPEALSRLRPLNLYGWSKHSFDRWAVDEAAQGRAPPFWAGLKFFNVYGPNEYHKGDMKSVAAKNFELVRAGQSVPLFRSHRPDFADGEQLRDFVYVKDCVAIAQWLFEHRPVSGVYNVGSGKARSFKALIGAIATSLGQEADITYVDMPLAIRDKYQYFTEANMQRLLSIGYDQPLTSLEDGVRDYVQNYLSNSDPFF